jgi:two-component system LytT family response regulator
MGPPLEEARPIRVLIADDEPLGRDCVRAGIEAAGGMDVIAECGDGPSAVQAITDLDPDLVFLDVQMPGQNGFEVIASVGPTRMPPVVFVTAYDEHAIRAFEVHALDYVLKPFDDARFREVIAHARERLAADRRQAFRSTLTSLLEELRPAGAPFARRVMVEVDERFRFITVEAIDYIETEGNYLRLHCGKDIHRVRSTLTALMQRLDPACFVRIHRSTAINLDRIREVQQWFGGDYLAILRDGTQLRIGRRYRSALLRPTL